MFAAIFIGTATFGTIAEFHLRIILFCDTTDGTFMYGIIPVISHYIKAPSIPVDLFLQLKILQDILAEEEEIVGQGCQYCEFSRQGGSDNSIKQINPVKIGQILDLHR